MSKRPLSLEFSERMTGFVTFGGRIDCETGFQQGRKENTRCDISVAINIDDIDAFVRDPNAEAIATGYVECAKLGGRCVVEKARFNLLVDVIPHRREFKDIRYRLLICTPIGRSLTFSGVKFVDDHGIIHMWRDTTKLFTKIFEGDVSGGDEDEAKIVATGILRLPFVALLKSLVSFHSNPPNLASRLRASWRYLKFFARRLWQVYGPIQLR